MAQIPIYGRQVVDQPVETARLDMNNFTSGGQAMKETGQQLDQIASEFARLDTLKKKTKATNDLAIELDQIQTEAEADPDTDSLPKYQQRIDEAVGKQLVNVPDGQARLQANEEFRVRSYNTFARVRDNFRSKQIRDQQDYMILGIEQNKKNYVFSADPAEKQIALDSALKLIDESAQAGVMTLDSATRLKDQTQKDFNYSEAAFDAQNLPDVFLKDVGKYGLDKAEAAKLKTLAANRKKKIEIEQIKAQKKLQADNSIELTKALIQGQQEMTVSDISSMISSGDVSAEFGRAYINAISYPITDEEIASDKSEFIPYLQSIFESENQESIIANLASVLQGGADGKTNQKELNLLLKMSIKRNEELNKGESAFSSFGKALANMFGRKKKSVDVMNDYVNSVESGKTPEAAKQEAIEKEQIRSNPNRSKYTVGQVFENPMGTFEVIGYDFDGEPILRKK